MRKIKFLVVLLIMCMAMVACKSSEDKSSKKESITNKTNEEQSEEGATSENSEDESQVTPLLYKVTHENGAEVWLFGSIHIGIDEMYPLPDYVMDAYDSADVLAVECDIVAAESDISGLTDIMASMVYADGTSISDHISPELYEASVEILKENNYYNQFLDYYMPSFWYNIISTFAYEDLGYDLNGGVDRFLIEQANEDEKEISEIESVEEQYDMLAGFSPELQEFLLEDAVASYGNQTTEIATEDLMVAWCEGDSEALDSSINPIAAILLSDEEELLIDEFYDAMYTNRNILMTDYAEDALLDGEDVFICVGAAHVVSEGGMVDLLEERGYTVEQVSPDGQ